jgi:hypothetical protein
VAVFVVLVVADFTETLQFRAKERVDIFLAIDFPVQNIIFPIHHDRLDA